MSVVARTLGIGAKRSRPAIARAARAATMATIRDGGRERSYQANPPTSTATRIAIVTACQLIASPPCRRSLGATKELRAALRRDRAIHVEDSGDLGREVPAARQDVDARTVGDHLSLTEEHRALGESGGELDIVRRAPHRRAGIGQLVDPAGELLLARAV